MRGAERRKGLVYGPEFLKIKSEKDENEFECYDNSFFSANFQLPVRKLCTGASAPLPLDPGSWILTQVIEATAQPGCLSNHYFDQGEQKKIYWQLQVSRIPLDKNNPTWNKKDLTPPFVYNCFDPSLKIDFDSVKIKFQRADLDIFELANTPFPSIYISATDLKQLKFPQGAKNQEFFSKDLAIFQDQSS